MQLSALDRRVPLSEGAKGAVEVLPLRHPGEASLVATIERHHVYLFERADSDLCLVAEHEGSASSNCLPRPQLLTREGLSLLVQEWEGRPATLVVTVPDGYDKARLGKVTTRVVNNAAALPTDLTARKVTLSGAAVPEVSLDVSSLLRGAELGTPAGTTAVANVANARAALLDLARSAQLYAGSTAAWPGLPKR